MVDVAQLVRASVCGTEGRGFEPHHLPEARLDILDGLFHFSDSEWTKHKFLEFVIQQYSQRSSLPKHLLKFLRY